MAHRVVDVGAVQNEAGGIGAAAVDGNLLTHAHDQAATGGPSRDHARLQNGQLGEAAAVQGQIANLLVVDQTADCGVGGFHQRSGSGDDHLLGDRSDAQGQVHDRLLSQVQIQPLANSGLKPGQFGTDLIGSQGQLRDPVAAGIIGKAHTDGVGIKMGDRDVDSRKHASGRVGHSSQDGG